jgi:hypothetical protein
MRAQLSMVTSLSTSISDGKEHQLDLSSCWFRSLFLELDNARLLGIYSIHSKRVCEQNAL